MPAKPTTKTGAPAQESAKSFKEALGLYDRLSRHDVPATNTRSGRPPLGSASGNNRPRHPEVGDEGLGLDDPTEEAERSLVLKANMSSHSTKGKRPLPGSKANTKVKRGPFQAHAQQGSLPRFRLLSKGTEDTELEAPKTPILADRARKEVFRRKRTTRPLPQTRKTVPSPAGQSAVIATGSETLAPAGSPTGQSQSSQDVQSDHVRCDKVGFGADLDGETVSGTFEWIKTILSSPHPLLNRISIRREVYQPSDLNLFQMQMEMNAKGACVDIQSLYNKKNFVIQVALMLLAESERESHRFCAISIVEDSCDSTVWNNYHARRRTIQVDLVTDAANSRLTMIERETVRGEILGALYEKQVELEDYEGTVDERHEGMRSELKRVQELHEHYRRKGLEWIA